MWRSQCNYGFIWGNVSSCICACSSCHLPRLQHRQHQQMSDLCCVRKQCEGRNAMMGSFGGMSHLVFVPEAHLVTFLDSSIDVRFLSCSLHLSRGRCTLVLYFPTAISMFRTILYFIFPSIFNLWNVVHLALNSCPSINALSYFYFPLSILFFSPYDSSLFLKFLEMILNFSIINRSDLFW